MRNALIASALAVAFFGCMSFNVDALERVKPGMTAKEVTKLLGPPIAKSAWMPDKRPADRPEAKPKDREWDEYWTYVKTYHWGMPTSAQIFFKRDVVVDVFVQK